MKRVLQCNIFRCRSHLFLWRRSELFGFLGSEGCWHVKCQHHLIVAQSLVILETGHKVVREGNQCFDTMTQLTVTKVLQYMAYLQILIEVLNFFKHNAHPSVKCSSFPFGLSLFRGCHSKSLFSISTCIPLSSNYTKILAYPIWIYPKLCFSIELSMSQITLNHIFLKKKHF